MANNELEHELPLTRGDAGVEANVEAGVEAGRVLRTVLRGGAERLEAAAAPAATARLMRWCSH